MNVYVASSWRNEFQPEVVHKLIEAGFHAYDFRHPDVDDEGFHWSSIDTRWKDWDVQGLRRGLNHEIAIQGFGHDFTAMQWADACILVLPCGRSAHLEAGWFTGRGRPCYFYAPHGVRVEPELMYRLGRLITDDLDEILTDLRIQELARRFS